MRPEQGTQEEGRNREVMEDGAEDSACMQAAIGDGGKKTYRQQEQISTGQ